MGSPPADARFAKTGDGAIVIVPARDGVQIDVDRRAARSSAPCSRPPGARVGRVVVSTKSPAFTTEKARSYGIKRSLASYSTFYSGTPDRINNLQLAVKLIDGTLVPPGGTFSLNDEVGPRTLERGFRVAPVIIGGEYEEDVGGGVSQVATTVFNAAWEAGVKVLERNPHSLYISRYPLGRDATVNYPDLDLKFLNDTGKWIVVLGGGRQRRHLDHARGHADRAARRQRPGAARDDGRGPDRARTRPDAVRRHEGSRGIRLGAEHGRREADRLQEGRQCSLRRDVADELPGREARDPRRHEAEARAAAADHDHADDDHHDADDDHADDAGPAPTEGA